MAALARSKVRISKIEVGKFAAPCRAREAASNHSQICLKWQLLKLKQEEFLEERTLAYAVETRY